MRGAAGGRLQEQHALSVSNSATTKYIMLCTQAIFLGRNPPTLEDARAGDQTVITNNEIDARVGQQMEAFKSNVLGSDYQPGASECALFYCAQNIECVYFRRRLKSSVLCSDYQPGANE